MSNKRDLYKKYVETFGVNPTLLEVFTSLGELGIAICLRFLTHTCKQSTPLYLDEKFHEAYARVHIAIEQIIEMMAEGEKQLFLTKKHYLLNEMEMKIRDRENENTSI